MAYGKLSKRYLALPLRFKLTLWNTLIAMLIAVAALVAVREGLRWMLVKELMVALQDEVYEIAISADRTYKDSEGIYEEMEHTSAGHIRHGWFLQLLGERGEEVLWSSENTPEQFAHASRLNADSLETDQTTFRFAQRKLDRSGLPVYWVRVGTSTDFIEEDVGNVTQIIMPVLLVIFLLTPIGGYIVAGRATSPLQQIISTSRELHPRHMEERLPLRGTGDELDELSIEINSFLDEIAEHLRRNREFIANAAHELRSPLAAMTASVDVVLSRDRTNEEYREQLATVTEECRQLTDLVNQLLLLAETDMHEPNGDAGPVRFDAIVEKSFEIYHATAEEANIAMQIELERYIQVNGDSTRLRQLANNLIDNAIKYTPPGGSVTVRLSCNREQKSAVLTVQDTGIGIDLAEHKRIFDRFYQVDVSRQHQAIVHGTGLGLSICASIVELYGGNITVESKPGEGTTFTVVLPLAVDSAEFEQDHQTAHHVNAAG